MNWTATAVVLVEDNGTSHTLIGNGEGESKEQALVEALLEVIYWVIETYHDKIQDLLDDKIKWTLQIATAVKRPI